MGDKNQVPTQEVEKRRGSKQKIQGERIIREEGRSCLCYPQNLNTAVVLNTFHHSITSYPITSLTLLIFSCTKSQVQFRVFIQALSLVQFFFIRHPLYLHTNACTLPLPKPIPYAPHQIKYFTKKLLNQAYNCTSIVK